MKNIAKVAVEKVNYDFDKLYEYIVPDEVKTINLIGCKVLVPFGKGNSKRQGVVFDVQKSNTGNKNLKCILSVLCQAPFLNDEMIKLACWMKHIYYCTYFEAINTIIPSSLSFKVTSYYRVNKNFGPVNERFRPIIEYLHSFKKPVLREKIFKDLNLDKDDPSLEKLTKMGVLFRTDSAIQRSKDAKVKMIRVLSPMDFSKATQKQKAVYDFISGREKVSLKEVCYYTGVSKCVVDNLVKKNMLEYFEDAVFRVPNNATSSSILKKDISLTPEQDTAYQSIRKQYNDQKGSTALLYGVTGSGKTSVFMRLIEEVYSEGRGIIVMVPEIALTAQVIELFKMRFGNEVAVFHSSLSSGERADEWKRVKNGDAKIVVGTRTAVFAPFNDVGLIIMDEEQEYTYKSESSPRFHSKDVARFRVKYSGGLLVLSSATPSVETFAYAKASRYSLNILKNRYGNVRLPKVTIVDMNSEVLNGNLGPVSNKLSSSLKKNLEEKKQSIILLNRRGYNTFASCKVCNNAVLCPHCSISLTYHKSNGRLMCHYCGYSCEFSDKCPNCGQKGLVLTGLGTQKAEQTIKELLPEARILRMDTDTMMSKSSHEKCFNQFLNKKFDIMIGTQMVAKGLNFPDVTLVGILSADQSLYCDDFRSYERAFSLFTQVVGRSGRGSFEGQAIIQTFTPENSIIKLAATQNYDAFFESEIKIRQIMKYPPFVDIVIIGFTGQDKTSTEKAAIFFRESIKKVIENSKLNIPIIIFGPSPASIIKVNNKYRYKIMIKTHDNNVFRKIMSKLYIAFLSKKEYNKVKIFFDVNPKTIM